MKTSESIVNIAFALLKAQKKIGAASKGSANPFFKSKYADLGSVMEACKEHLNNEGISILQPVGNENGRHTVTTFLLHESGEFMSETMVLEVPKSNMQDLGSAISYARRYGLQSFGFIPAEDDDAEKSMERKQAPKELEIKKSSFKKQSISNPGQPSQSALEGSVNNSTTLNPSNITTLSSNNLTEWK